MNGDGVHTRTHESTHMTNVDTILLKIDIFYAIGRVRERESIDVFDIIIIKKSVWFEGQARNHSMNFKFNKFNIQEHKVVLGLFKHIF